MMSTILSICGQECLSLDLFRHERWCFVSSFETTVCDTTFTPKNWSLLIGDDWWRFSKAFDSICLDQYDEDLDIKVVIVFGYPLSSFTIIIKISLRYLLTSFFSDMSENFRGYPRIIHLYFLDGIFPSFFHYKPTMDGLLNHPWPSPGSWSGSPNQAEEKRWFLFLVMINKNLYSIYL